MTVALVVLAAAVAALSGLPAVLAPRHRPGALRHAQRLGTALLVLATMLGAAGALRSLLAIDSTRSIDVPWSVPGARLFIEVDALSALFLLQIFGLSLLGSIYGLAYWTPEAHPDSTRRVTAAWGILTGAMTVLVIARNAVLFLIGWEVMAIAAFVAMTAEDELPEVRAAGHIYLVAARAGALALIGAFCLLHSVTGSFDFESPAPGSAGPGALTAMFLLALFGFGMKAGLMPLHFWLPAAHASAPSHVSALMSGVLLKMGVYGLARFLTLFPDPPRWWGELLLGLGVISAVLGIAAALAQRDLKRTLAFSSVENIGIIAIGLGLATIGRSVGRTELVMLGLGGALLHAVNHGIFKSLLFYAAGAVVHTAGTRELDRLGGLLRAMPQVGLFFLVGAAAIAGLPPLNGFVSELMITLGLFSATVDTAANGVWLLGAAVAVAALATTGALALACFVRAFGAVFLGVARSAPSHQTAAERTTTDQTAADRTAADRTAADRTTTDRTTTDRTTTDRTTADQGHDPPALMTVPMLVLAVTAAFIGLVPISVAPLLERAIAAFAPETTGAFGPLAPLAGLAPLTSLSLTGALLGGLLALVWQVLAARIRAGGVANGPTWDCGYAAPTSRMQYTASSFSAWLVQIFSVVTRPEKRGATGLPLFPAAASLEVDAREALRDTVLPAGRAIGRLLARFRWFQRGNIHAYLLYLLIAVVALHFVR